MIERGKSVTEILATQLPAIRARRQLSAAALAQRIKELGGGLDRAAISKIETGARGVSLDEAILLAVALDLAPVHLFVPRDDKDAVSLTPLISASADDVRGWVRGQQPLPGRDDRAYRTEVPDSEWAQGSRKLQDALAQVDRAKHRFRVAEARLERLSEESSRASATASVLSRGEAAGLGGIDRHVDLAYERIAEAKVDLAEARAHLARVKSEEGVHDGQR